MADVSYLTTSHPRQKRVLPTRSRRGGPGIGSCDVDLMILDAQRRRCAYLPSPCRCFALIFCTGDNEPLIPADTPFLLTTNAALLQSPSKSANFGLNTFANQRYFDRADVIKAYREQLNIQTPEFSLLSEDATVGGRFRPRSSGEVRTSWSCMTCNHVVLGAASRITQTLLMQRMRNDIGNTRSLKSDNGCARRRS